LLRQLLLLNPQVQVLLLRLLLLLRLHNRPQKLEFLL
jgi:hypothetical protein